MPDATTRIKTLTFSGLRGQKATHELSGCNLFVGPNGSGKSTRIEAIALAALGHIPGQDRQPKAMVAALSHEDAIRVGMTIEVDGVVHEIARERANVSGTGKSTDTIPPSLGDPPLGDQRIALDMANFLSLSNAKRHDLIREYLPLERVSMIAMGDVLGPALNAIGKAPDAPPGLLDASKTVLMAVTELWTESSALVVNTQFTKAIDLCKSSLSQQKQRRDGLQGAIKELLDETAIIGLETRIAKLEAAKTDAQASRDSLKERLAVQAAAEAAAEAHTNLTGALTEHIETATRSIADLEVSYASYEREIQRLNEQLVEAEDLVKTAEDHARRANAATETTASHLECQEERVEAAQSEQLEAQSIVDFLSAHGHDGGSCPLYEGCTHDISIIFTRHQKVAEQKADKHRSETELLQQAQTNHATAQAQQKEEQDVADGAKKLAEEFLPAKIAALQSALERDHRNRKTGQGKLVAMEHKLSEALAKRSELPTVENDETLVALLNAAETSLQKTCMELDECAERRHAALATEKVSAQLMEAEALVVAWKAAETCLGAKGLLGQCIEQAVEPVRVAMNDALHVVWPERQVLLNKSLRAGVPVLEFGLEHPELGTFVRMDSLSTGELAVFWSAFVVAILQHVNPRIKLLLCDDLDRLDNAACRDFLSACSQYVERGLIHTFVGATCRAETAACAPTSMNIITLPEPHKGA